MNAMSHAKEEREEVRRLTNVTMGHMEEFEVKSMVELIGRLMEDHSSVAVMAAHNHVELARVATALEGINESLKILAAR